MTKRFRWVVLGLLAFALSLGNAPARADSASVSNVNDGFGSTFSLSAVCNSGNCTVMLTINTTSATEYSDINAVNFKIGSKDTFSGSLTLNPTGGTWSSTTGSLNSNSNTCGGNAGGFICSQAVTPISSNEAATRAASGGTTLSWKWTNVQYSGPLTISHIGYEYNNSTGTKDGLIVSYPFAKSLPEPTSICLMLVGLVGLAAAVRRRR